jgi:transcriptional regulator with GAF, ATPase, and Fis domain
LSDAEFDRFLNAARELAPLLDEAGLVRARAAFHELERQATARLLPRGGPDAWPGRFGILGQCAPLLAVFERIDRFARSDLPVVIHGESGTGKELVARALHQQSQRARQAYVLENCAAIPETLLESILFGHVKGAFTGAHRDSPGHFVSADGGTLFLDEVGDMSPGMQVKLLRVLETGEVRPVGGTAVKRVDVRVLTASNKDLAAMMGRREFREDLFHRLHVLVIELPALRERGDDIWLLACFFAAKTAAELGRPITLLPEIKAPLLAARWPGNVRQLENEIRRAAALSDTGSLGPSDLSPNL